MLYSCRGRDYNTTGRQTENEVSHMVSMASMVCMGISCGICMLLPLVLLIVIRQRTGTGFLPFFTGYGVMFLFALTLEAAVHRIILSTPAGTVISGNLWLYALYGGVMAAVFEECGRLIAFRTVLRKHQDRDATALMYGAGHGGFEAMAITGVTMINNLIWSSMINGGNAGQLTAGLEGELLEKVQRTIAELTSISPVVFLLGGVERVFAIAMHISLSVMVWFAAKGKGEPKLFFLAMAVHATVDACSVMLSGSGLPLVAMEGIVGGLSVLCALLARRIWLPRSGSAEGK